MVSTQVMTVEGRACHHWPKPDQVGVCQPTGQPLQAWASTGGARSSCQRTWVLPKPSELVGPTEMGGSLTPEPPLLGSLSRGTTPRVTTNPDGRCSSAMLAPEHRSADWS